jgi:peptidoglycan/xylan/chitin deacetylase (PgdA/CDA1 family)
MNGRRKNRILNCIRSRVAFLFVSIIVLLPLLSVFRIIKDAGLHDSRKVGVIAPLQVRKIDEVKTPINMFAAPYVTVTFDDGWESIYTQALPLLQKYGIRTTQYVLSGTLKDENYLSMAQVKAMQSAGHEIACHGVNHADLPSLDAKKLTFELSSCQQTFSKELGPIRDFASPYGHYTPETITAIKKYYQSHRNTNGDLTNGINEADVNIEQYFNQYDLIAATVRDTTTVEQLRALFEYAKQHNGWVILNYHQIDDGPSQYALVMSKLEEQMRFVSESNVRIITISEGIDAVTKIEGARF